MQGMGVVKDTSELCAGGKHQCCQVHLSSTGGSKLGWCTSNFANSVLGVWVPSSRHSLGRG